LSLRLYLENNSNVMATYILPANTVVETVKLAIMYRANKFTFDIIETSSLNDVEINRIDVEHTI